MIQTLHLVIHFQCPEACIFFAHLFALYSYMTK